MPEGHQGITSHDHLVLVFDSVSEQQSAIKQLIQSHQADGKVCFNLSTGEGLPFEKNRAVGSLSIYHRARWAKGDTASEMLGNVLGHLMKIINESDEGETIRLLDEKQWIKDFNLNLEDILSYEARLDKIIETLQCS